MILNEPVGYVENMGVLPDFAKIVTEHESADVVQLFIRSYEELPLELPKARSLMNENTIFWVCYPKQTGRIKTDINRDILYNYAILMKWKGIGMFSVNDDWSAMRFKSI